MCKLRNSLPEDCPVNPRVFNSVPDLYFLPRCQEFHLHNSLAMATMKMCPDFAWCTLGCNIFSFETSLGKKQDPQAHCGNSLL
jgi:hypothetical protein